MPCHPGWESLSKCKQYCTDHEPSSCCFYLSNLWVSCVYQKGSHYGLKTSVDRQTMPSSAVCFYWLFPHIFNIVCIIINWNWFGFNLLLVAFVISVATWGRKNSTVQCILLGLETLNYLGVSCIACRMYELQQPLRVQILMLHLSEDWYGVKCLCIWSATCIWVLNGEAAPQGCCVAISVFQTQ